MLKCFFSAFAICVLISPALSQSSTRPASQTAESKEQKELSRKVQLLLLETVQLTGELKNLDNRVLARVAVADLLWKDQEPAARRYYLEAFDILRKALDSADPNDIETDESLSHLSQLREQLLQSLSQHDSRMARELMAKTRLPVASEDPNTSPENVTTSKTDEIDDESRLELSLAAAMVEQDPKESLRIAQQSLNQGHYSQLFPVLVKMLEKDPKAAREFATEVFGKLRKEDFATNEDAMSLAMSLAVEGIYSTQNPTQDESEKQPLLLDTKSFQELIALVADAALKQQSGQGRNYLLLSLRSFVDELQEFAPAQAARLKKRFAEMGKEEESDQYYRSQKLAEAKDTNALLEMAKTAPREARDSVYGQAASAAWGKGDKTKAAEIVAKHITSPYERKRLLDSFQEQSISEAFEKQDIDQARELIGQTRSVERRAEQLLELAAALSETNKKKQALEVLDEVQALLPVKARNAEELNLQMKLAGSLSGLAPERGFTLLSPVIDHINELTEAMAMVSSFVPWSPMRMKGTEFNINSSDVLYGFQSISSKDVRTLAMVDFDRIKVLFDKFQRPELRINAQLSIARSILQPDVGDCTCPANRRIKPPRKQ